MINNRQMVAVAILAPAFLTAAAPANTRIGLKCTGDLPPTGSLDLM